MCYHSIRRWNEIHGSDDKTLAQKWLQLIRKFLNKQNQQLINNVYFLNLKIQRKCLVQKLIRCSILFSSGDARIKMAERQKEAKVYRGYIKAVICLSLWTLESTIRGPIEAFSLLTPIQYVWSASLSSALHPMNNNKSSRLLMHEYPFLSPLAF